MLPSEFGPWQTVYWWSRRIVRRLLFGTIHDVALMIDREESGREASPPDSVLDSQTVKAPFAEQRGNDGAKKVVGRKRNVAVDPAGRCLRQRRGPADFGRQPQTSALAQAPPADDGYDRTRLMDTAAYLDFVVEFVWRSDKQVGFEVISRRQVVERTFGWMIR